LLVGGLGYKDCSGCDKLHAFAINLLTPALLFKLAYVLVLLSSSLQHIRIASLAHKPDHQWICKEQRLCKRGIFDSDVGLVAHLGISYVLGIVSQ
jgi:hypothetical protein